MDLKELRELVEEDAEAHVAYRADYDAAHPSSGEYVQLRERAEDVRGKLVKALLEQAPYLLTQAERGVKAEPLAAVLEKMLERGDKEGRLKLARAALNAYRQAGQGQAKKPGSLKAELETDKTKKRSKPARWKSATEIAGYEAHSPGADEGFEGGPRI